MVEFIVQEENENKTIYQFEGNNLKISDSKKEVIM